MLCYDLWCGWLWSLLIEALNLCKRWDSLHPWFTPLCLNTELKSHLDIIRNDLLFRCASSTGWYGCYIWMVLINRNERCGLQIRQQHRVIKMLCWRNQCSIAHHVMQYRSGWVGSEGDSKLSLILQGACFRLGQIWILGLDMIQSTEYMLSCIIHLILPRHNGQKFTEYEWYAARVRI